MIQAEHRSGTEKQGEFHLKLNAPTLNHLYSDFFKCQFA